MRKYTILFLILICFFAPAAAIEHVGYKEYFRSPQEYNGSDLYINCTVYKVDTDTFAEKNVTLIYAYEEKQSNMFCIAIENFDQYYWYELSDAYLGMTPAYYDVITENVRIELHPRKRIDRILRNDEISVIGVGYGFTAADEPLIVGVAITIHE